MGNLDFGGAGRKCVSQCRNECVDFSTGIQRVDKRAVVGPQHATLIGHLDMGDSLAQAVHGTRRQASEGAVIALAADGSDVVVTAAYGGHQPRDFLRWVLQICIKRDGNLALHMFKASQDRHVLSEVAVEQHHPRDIRAAMELSRQHLGGSVSAAVVDEDHFVALSKRIQHGVQALEQRVQHVFFVVDRNHHRDGDAIQGARCHDRRCLQTSARARQTRAVSSSVIAGKSGSVRMLRPIRSAFGSWPSAQPSER